MTLLSTRLWPELQKFTRSLRRSAVIGFSAMTLLTLTFPGHAANLVVNGSFSQLTAPCTSVDGTCAIAPSLLTGWTASGGLSCVVVFPFVAPFDFCPVQGGLRLWFATASSPGPSPDGGNYVAVDADNVCCPNDLFQTLTGLVPGQRYTVSFFQAGGQLDGRGTGQPTTEFWQVSLCTVNSLVCDTAASDQMHAAQNIVGWMSQKLTLMASSATAVLHFMAMGSPQGEPPIALLDGVSVERAVESCPLTQGFWKTHPSVWPVSSLTLGGRTYTEAQLLTILGTPPKEDASLILAHQLIAAKLNIADGSDPGPIQTALAAADSELAAVGPLPAGVRADTAAGQAMTATAATLDQYNNGLLTPDCTAIVPGQ